MCELNLEPCEIWNEIERKARKDHRCNCCSRTISPGETYMVHFSKFEGEINTQKCCLECKADRKIFANSHDGTLCDPANLLSMLHECIGEEPETKEQWQPVIDRIKSRQSIKAA